MADSDRLIRRAYVASAVVWVALLFLTPPLAAAASTAGNAAALAVYAIGSAICHQRPERSFAFAGVQMPVCARCTGIYIGAALAAVVSVILSAPGLVTPKRRSREGGWPRWTIAAISTVPSLLTLVYEWTTGHTPANGIRAASGAPIGVVVSWLVLKLH
jgi:hypothetical protein